MTKLYKAETEIAQAFAPMAARIEAELFARFELEFKAYAKMQREHAETLKASGKVYYCTSGGSALYSAAKRAGLALGMRYASHGKWVDAETPVLSVFAESFARKEAAQQAADIFNGFIAKFTAKVGDLEGAKVTWLSGAGDCNIVGKRNGKSVSIDQQTVWKRSVHGNIFCQFPARIYVDRKFTPAARYADAVAA